MPMIAFIGVRISWLIAARNELLAWFAASAALGRLAQIGEQAGVVDRDGRLLRQADEEVQVRRRERPAAAPVRQTAIMPFTPLAAEQRRDHQPLVLLAVGVPAMWTARASA